MTRLRNFIASNRGASAAEFALVLPLMLLFLFGIIDAGRYAWEFNKAEKATQAGARFAVVTDMVPSGLITYSFAVSGGVPQGTVVPKSSFGGIVCNSTACTCTDGSACGFGQTRDGAAFTRIVNRMQRVKPDIAEANVVIDYAWSGLGYSGDPNGPDVAPLVNVQLQNMRFSPLTLFLFGGTIPLPSASYSLTLEDGQGTESDG